MATNWGIWQSKRIPSYVSPQQSYALIWPFGHELGGCFQVSNYYSSKKSENWSMFPLFFFEKDHKVQRHPAPLPGSWDARAITFHCWPAGPTANTRWTTGCRSSHDRNRVGGRSWRTASSPTQVTEKVENPNPYAPWCWYMYLQNWVIFEANVGKYSSTMEHMGNDMI